MKEKPTLQVAIVGAGVAGLASAIRLAVAGHQVTVFEANGYPGGKLSQIENGGYRFDAGPSLFTLPALVDELFTLCDENPKDHFDYLRLEEICRYFYSDGTRLTAFADREKLKKEFFEKLGEAPEAVEKALNRSTFLYENLSDLFMFSSLTDVRTFLSKSARKAYLNLPRLGFFSTMDQVNRSGLQREKSVQFFNRFATYNGSSPYLAPATLHIIPHLEMSMGAYFPKGGMIAITNSLLELAKRQGVTFHFHTPVTKIEVENKQIIGLYTSQGFRSFDRVVSNMDVVNSYKKLLPDIKPPRFLLTQPKSSSALIFYWGIRKSFQDLSLHNIFFSGDYKEEFDCLFKTKTITDDPTIYVNISSKYHPSDAPEGCENWFTMINVPNNSGQNWDELIAKARTSIIKKLSSTLGVDIEPFIETQDILDPRSIESRTSSAQGALYGNSSNSLFAAFLRHANKSRRVKGLYFCGGSVHPGGGIPMSLASAKILAQYFS